MECKVSIRTFIKCSQNIPRGVNGHGTKCSYKNVSEGSQKVLIGSFTEHSLESSYSFRPSLRMIMTANLNSCSRLKFLDLIYAIGLSITSRIMNILEVELIYLC